MSMTMWLSKRLLLNIAASIITISDCSLVKAIQLNIPPSAVNASIPHTNSFASFSIEPAFWTEFFGNLSAPNQITLDLFARIVERGGNPIIRPGGITQDSMIYDPTVKGVVRATSSEGGIYRTTVGPEYYQSWDLLPECTKFVSALNFGNNSLEIAEGLAVASLRYQAKRIKFLELGNEPTNYPPSRWDNSTKSYVQQWKNWTAQIDGILNQTLVANKSTALLSHRHWWASSATTDQTGLNVRPVDIIPAGVDSRDQVAQYSIHSYQFATCDPSRAALATIANIIDHSLLTYYVDSEIMPSASAALSTGIPWVVGEFNSIACAGNPNVSDTFAGALWALDMDLIYATRNASGVYLHQGATLVFQSSDQVNSAGDNGSPGYSTYDFLYPRNSSQRGSPRALPSFLAQLFMAEAMATPGTRVQAIDVPSELDPARIAAYAFYNNNGLSKVALLNLHLYYPNSTTDFSARIDLSQQQGNRKAWVKRMTAPSVDEKETAMATWAGQSFKNGTANGRLEIEEVDQGGLVTVRGSEAVLVFFQKEAIFGW